MIKRIPITDTTTGQTIVLEGEPTDRLPNNNTVLIDPRNGKIYGSGSELATIPNDHPLMQLPDTTWYAPLYGLDRRENHNNMGYHAHILMRKSGKHVRCGYLVTMSDGLVYAVEHGEEGRPLFSMEKRINAIRRELEIATAEHEFKNIPDDAFLRPGSPSWVLFPKSW